ncbi:hypothetical protein HMF3257_04015 [Spirosoma telluris]|uniref:Uncharacterized protein n=1 Tax=Spirosoma telluris TaxID=2183553 RepID=A0A327NF39_9BACT|nr:hypothetical protein HMF3257_04015 [Spirosoma telluris]
MCNGSTYSVSFYSSVATVTANAGQVVGNSITGIPVGTAVNVTATAGAGCVEVQTVASPASCTTGCTLPKLSVGQPICNGNGTYSVSYTLDGPGSVSAIGGIIVGNTVTNIAIGTDVIISASINGSCVVSHKVTSILDCSTLCLSPGITLSGPVCSTNGTSYYFNYTVTAGTTVTIPTGGGVVDATTGTITIYTGIAPFTHPFLLVERPGCLPTTVDLPLANCPFCNKPVLTVGSPVCNGSTYSVSFYSSVASVTANAGQVVGNSITGIPWART